MAHELTIRASGDVEMAYVGEQPWHGLGQKIEPGATVEQWTKAAGMDWTVDKAPVQYRFGKTMHTVADRVVLHRSDTGVPLGVVGHEYEIVQPAQCLEFFRDLVDAVGLTIESAGTLFGGKKFWALSRVGEEALVGDKDLVRGYLLLSTSADGSRATTAKHTSIRVVCYNTLTYAGAEDGAEVRVTHGTKFNPERVKQLLGVAPKSFQSFMEDMRKLTKVSVDDAKAEELTTTLLKQDTADGRRYDAIMDLFRGDAIGADLPGFQGTAWGWLNSVTEYADHGRSIKSASHRLNSALYGRADTMKSKARDMALALV